MRLKRAILSKKSKLLKPAVVCSSLGKVLFAGKRQQIHLMGLRARYQVWQFIAAAGTAVYLTRVQMRDTERKAASFAFPPAGRDATSKGIFCVTACVARHKERSAEWRTLVHVKELSIWAKRDVGNKWAKFWPASGRLKTEGIYSTVELPAFASCSQKNLHSSSLMRAFHLQPVGKEESSSFQIIFKQNSTIF